MTEEDTVKGEVDSTSSIPGAKFAFLVVATEDSVDVRPLPSDANVPGPKNMDEIYDACNTLCRNINNTQIAQAVGGALAAAAMQQAEQAQSRPNIVVPTGVNASKLAVER